MPLLIPQTPNTPPTLHAQNRPLFPAQIRFHGDNTPPNPHTQPPHPTPTSDQWKLSQLFACHAKKCDDFVGEPVRRRRSVAGNLSG